ncbi:wd repeat [Pyrenophora seminiperda CCB06]|uniref:Wd repeat n=1 Tax=Pyrenophora seminiperda CCB06 TaxID=1302712 RepID=A0A3M7LY95_9PLEO|nr:wd repeat [Pyrenophora seminiperda CCB06]
MGPAMCWTGASSDIHTLAWSPDGEHFAAGAVAVDDPDSMQYNRPNNLLFGDVTHGTIQELAEHYKMREKTESGANSSHAMFASQDPKVYTTVSSVAFSTTGRFMYSAGYDNHIGIWHTDVESVQPILGAKLNVRDQIDILSVNRTHEGVLATAARSHSEKAIRLLRIDEEDPSRFDKWSFHSPKAVSRTDLKILPTALQFEPKYGNLLLAGFGANTRESVFDMTGDLCLWDVETQKALQIHGASKNVFDVEFNPNRTDMPLFAVGCVAVGSVNKGTRSLIRLYDINGVDKFTCPLELECKALDMNDVVWCPHDEHLIAAGCTDSRAYIWDIRWPDDPLRILSHGKSLMPLQEGVKHEVTDTGVRFLSWGENATRLYSGASDGVVKVWDVTRAEENTFIKDLVDTDSGIMSGAFSADYSKLLIGEVNGSVNVLEVGRDDTSLKEAEKLRYMPYQDYEQDEIRSFSLDMRPAPDSGITEANYLLKTNQLRLVPMGSLPIKQAIQGPNYAGPFDQSPDALLLRAKALEFQQSLIVTPGPQCDITACKENPPTITSEEIGDSGRSVDRIPDELRRQWRADVSKLCLVPGKAKCTSCGRPARPLAGDDAGTKDKGIVLCERCSFSCFRCAATNTVEPATTTLSCATCGGLWDIGVLGYECIREPETSGARVQNVPDLRRWGRESYEEFLEDGETGFGDEDNALSEWFLQLGV